MPLRWLLAVPLLIASYVGTPIAYHVVHAWEVSTKFGRTEEFDVQAELVEELGKLASTSWPVLLAIVLFAANWWMTLAWPRIAILPTVPLVIGGVFGGGLSALVAVATPLTAWGLAWLAGRVVSWPATPGVARSAVEVVVKLRGGGRVRLQSRRLLLDKVPAPMDARASVTRVAIPYDRIVHVEAGSVLGQSRWRLANSSVLPLEPGPVVRVIGSGQQWMLPVEDAQALVALITARARSRQRPEPRPPLEHDHWREAKPMWEMAESRDVQPNNAKLSASIHHYLLVMSAITAAMAVAAMYRVFSESLGYLVGVAFFGGISVVTIRLWRSSCTRQKLAEENPVPPTVPDPDPRLAPLPGWSVAVHSIGL